MLDVRLLHIHLDSAVRYPVLVSEVGILHYSILFAETIVPANRASAKITAWVDFAGSKMGFRRNVFDGKDGTSEGMRESEVVFELRVTEEDDKTRMYHIPEPKCGRFSLLRDNGLGRQVKDRLNAQLTLLAYIEGKAAIQDENVH